jgi:hypothetical protein
LAPVFSELAKAVLAALAIELADAISGEAMLAAMPTASFAVLTTARAER